MDFYDIMSAGNKTCHVCDVLAQEQSCLAYLIGRLPVQPKERYVSWAEHVEINKYQPKALYAEARMCVGTKNEKSPKNTHK